MRAKAPSPRPALLFAAAAVTALVAAASLTLSRSLAAAAAVPAGKAGVASAMYLDRDPQKLVALGASWAYDWGPHIQPANLGIQTVPMIWGSGTITPTTMSALRRARLDGRARYLLGFNEPDNRSQSNMTPAQAAALWPQLEHTGLILGSPAPTTPVNGWLADFMKLARQRHMRVNFIALHYYLDFTNPGSVAGLRAQLIQVHNTYQLPIWITELGAMDIRQWAEQMLHPPSAVAAKTYMRSVFAMLNALPFVQRYAWFTDSCANESDCRLSSLFTRSGALTPEGREFQRDA